MVEAMRQTLLHKKVLCYSKMEESLNLTLQGNATRYCTADATWYVNPFYNSSWSNYSDCTPARHPDISSGYPDELTRIQLISSVGYGLSLVALIIALSIMVFCRRLHCKSNTLHINLFIAFILRASVSFIRDRQLVFMLNSHWKCKLFFVVFNYCITASYTWIFMEGLYLHLLVYNALLVENRGVKLYVIAGWALPVLAIFPWTLVKALQNNDNLCWKLYIVDQIAWLITGPTFAVLIINFLSLLYVSWKLCKNARQRANTSRTPNYRKLAKFILILMPLFGAPYIVLLVAFPPDFKETYTYLGIEMTYNSFQGLLLAVLLCFLNENVQNELKESWLRLKKRWNAYRIKTETTTPDLPLPQCARNMSGNCEENMSRTQLRSVQHTSSNGTLLTHI